MDEKKKHFLLSVSLFSFLFFVAVGISSACPIKWSTREVSERFISLISEIPVYNTIATLSEFSNLPESKSSEATDINLNSASNPGSDGIYHPESTSDGSDKTQPVPEPATIILLGSGLIGMLLRKMRKSG